MRDLACLSQVLCSTADGSIGVHGAEVGCRIILLLAEQFDYIGCSCSRRHFGIEETYPISSSHGATGTTNLASRTWTEVGRAKPPIQRHIQVMGVVQSMVHGG